MGVVSSRRIFNLLDKYDIINSNEKIKSDRKPDLWNLKMPL